MEHELQGELPDGWTLVKSRPETRNEGKGGQEKKSLAPSDSEAGNFGGKKNIGTGKKEQRGKKDHGQMVSEFS